MMKKISEEVKEEEKNRNGERKYYIKVDKLIYFQWCCCCCCFFPLSYTMFSARKDNFKSILHISFFLSIQAS